MHACTLVCHNTCVEARGQFMGVSLSSRGFQGSNSGCQAWWQMPLSDKPSYWQEEVGFLFLFLFLIYLFAWCIWVLSFLLVTQMYIWYIFVLQIWKFSFFILVSLCVCVWGGSTGWCQVSLPIAFYLIFVLRVSQWPWNMVTRLNWQGSPGVVLSLCLPSVGYIWLLYVSEWVLGIGTQVLVLASKVFTNWAISSDPWRTFDSISCSWDLSAMDSLDVPAWCLCVWGPQSGWERPNPSSASL